MPELVNVPDVDGVPPVLFAKGAGLGIALATGDAAGILPTSGATQWGIFQQGRPVVTCENVVAFDHKADWAISDYPVEGGQFESYNKVTIPFDCRLVFTAGGSEQSRTKLLNSLRAIVGDLKFYDAVSPEAVYTPVNLIHLDYRRTAQNGRGLLVVSVLCQQVRQVASSTTGAAGGGDATGQDTPSATGNVGQTAAPSGADPVNGGTVQARDATPAEMQGVGPQAFAGGYNVGAGTTDGTTLGGASIGPGGYNADGSGSLGYGANFGNTSIAGPESISTPDSAGFSGGIDTPGQITMSDTPDLPVTSQSISGNTPAGPDEYQGFGPGP